MLKKKSFCLILMAIAIGILFIGSVNGAGKEKEVQIAQAGTGKIYEKIVEEKVPETPALTIENDFIKINMDGEAKIIGLVDRKTGVDYCLSPSTFIKIKKEGRTMAPSSYSYKDGKLNFEFDSGVSVVIGVGIMKKYFVFEILSASEDIEEVAFLNLKISISKFVNRMSGLIADETFSFCLRTNLKVSPAIGKEMKATAYKKYGLKEAMAIFTGCPYKELRSVLKSAIQNENLNYSALGGPFALDSEENRCSYNFTFDLSEYNVDKWIEIARISCIPIIHSDGWGQSWGHYEPRRDLFPNGIAGLKSVVEKIHSAGLKAGLHTMTGNISRNDPFVTPIPDKRLEKDRVFTLSEEIGESENVIPVLEKPHGLDTIWAYASRGNAIQIDDEIIQYSGYSGNLPYAFTGCTRGAFGTKVSSHKKGTPAYHLFSWWGTFQPDENSTMVDDVAECIAKVVNECGFDLIYMDGAGNMPEGRYGWHGTGRLRSAIFNKIKRPIRVEASEWGYHSWAFHSCIGAYDYPHWGLKRAIDLHCRNLEEYRNNSLLQYQLGWWAILGPTEFHDAETPDEIEYLCCKSLGWDSPMSFQGINVSRPPANMRQDEYLKMIGRYEKLRLTRYFSEEVREKLKKQKQDFHLVQSGDGEWQFLPTDYISHKVTGLQDGSTKWNITNIYSAQPLKLKIKALYSAEPYENPQGLTLADFGKDEFKILGNASGVTSTFIPSADFVKVGNMSAFYTANNMNNKREGAWSYASKVFSPTIDIRKYGAMGVWIYGDGKGEILNFQLTNPRQYNQPYDEHYTTVDFKGWKYFELLLRERDAETSGNYIWPYLYQAFYQVHRHPLVKEHLSGLAIYYNNLSAQDEVKCYISPVKALPAVKIKFSNPCLTINGKKIMFPVTLESGEFIEFNSISDCKLYDERGALIKEIKLQEKVPEIKQGENEIVFNCEGPEGYNSRANVTIIAYGEPLKGIAKGKEKLKEKFKNIDDCYLTLSEGKWNFVYQDRKVISLLDGKENVWNITNREEKEQNITELRIRVGGKIPAKGFEKAPIIENFEDLKPYEDSSEYAKYVSGPGKEGTAKKGVTQTFEQNKETKISKNCILYQAKSTLSDNSGWSCLGRKFSPSFNIPGAKGLSLWLKGDGKGAFLKVQLRDSEESWCDYYVKLDFTEWRYLELIEPSMGEINWSKLEYILFYLNGIPANSTSVCYIDDIRALQEISKEEIINPQLTITGKAIVFPVTLKKGDTIIFKSIDNCHLVDSEGNLKKINPSGEIPKLKMGNNSISFKCEGAISNELSIEISRQ